MRAGCNPAAFATSSPAVPSIADVCPSDINGEGWLNLADFAELQVNFDATSCP